MSSLESIESALEIADGLVRRLRVTLPAALLDREIDSRLDALGRSVALKGYRPGKVPRQVLQSRFGDRVRREVTEQLVRSALSDAITQQKLRPIGDAKIDAPPVGKGFDLTFFATFEVLPEITLNGLDGIPVDRPEPAIDDADIDHAIADLRQQKASWRRTARAARNGDRVTVNSSGLVDGRPVEGIAGEAVPLVLGQGRFLLQVEREIVGMAAGEERTFDVAIPADFGYADVAGHRVRLTVKVLDVSEPQLPPVDAQFVRRHGVESGEIADLRSQVAKRLADEFALLARAEVHRQLFRHLVTAEQLALPTILVEQEARNLQLASMRNLGIVDPGEARPVETFRQLAAERIHTQLLIEAIAVAREVKIDPQRVARRLDELYGASARAEPGDGDPEVRAQVERDILEEQVAEWLEQRARCTPKVMSYRQLTGAA